MPMKKKLTKEERREKRLRKACQWVLTYNGSHIVRDYRKRFKLDYTCALEDMKVIGALSPEKFANMKRAEEIRLKKKREQKGLQRERALRDRFPDSDDTFFFIAGYTSGGAPYGVTWKEMGMKPYERPEDAEDIPEQIVVEKERPQRQALPVRVAPFSRTSPNRKAESASSIALHLAVFVDLYYLNDVDQAMNTA